ncbi:glycosyltransferase [Convivina intestini]|uniref:glycosyltransferase n=1 Tax=Convivina intestini TaxID=1505726 RepID=UPI00200E3591|nr:glycosyltransferase [Convivina intestini]CAH1854761.1 UDP-N-acetylglucosamine--peptide N-acetylglucosaminyltransferase GtfA subunit [Convivina intestini]
MNIFINKGMGHGNSGVEHAQFYRAARFRQKNIPFKLVFTDLLPELHQHMQEWHLAEDEVIGMYDYLLSDDPDQYLKTGLIEKFSFQEDSLWDLTNTQRRQVRQTTGKYQETIIRDKRYSDEKKIYIVDDSRIFLENGDHKISWHFREVPSRGKVPTNIHLNNFRGNDYLFETFEELVTFFLGELENSFDKNIYFIDRGNENEEALVRAKKKGADFKIVDIVHAAHLVEFQNGHPLFNNFYQYMFDHFDTMDAVITATKLQRDAMKDDLKNQVEAADLNKIHAIPVGGADINEPAHHWDGKEARFVTASRLHPEKHISQIVKAIAALRKDGLNATLAIYGSGADEKPLNDLITELNLGDYVAVKGLSQNVVKDLQAYDAFVSASYSEGFGLTYIEAISDALPIATYANLYGAQELVQDGVNGKLAEFSRQDSDEDQNVVNLTAAMRAIFDDYDQLSQGAHEVAHVYQSDRIADQWQKLVEELS